LKPDDTPDVWNAAAAFPAAKPLLRRAASSGMNLRAGGFLTPAHPGLRAGRPSKRVVMRALTRTHETVRPARGGSWEANTAARPES